MDEIEQLLQLSRHAVTLAFEKLRDLDEKNIRQFSFSSEFPREVKAKADILIENILLKELGETGIDILSEEIGSVRGDGNQKSKLRFIVDPIDGTVNFLRGIYNCSISVALFNENTPIFGVLASYPSGEIAWGGKSLGAFINNKSINVSSIPKLAEAVLCTGLPTRFDFNSYAMIAQMNLMSKFGKVRMLGSASQSLLQVAKGAVDCYSEKEIMLWDVAAGIAIVEGAGGSIMISPGSSNLSLNVLADNSKLNLLILD